MRVGVCAAVALLAWACSACGTDESRTGSQSGQAEEFDADNSADLRSAESREPLRWRHAHEENWSSDPLPAWVLSPRSDEEPIGLRVEFRLQLPNFKIAFVDGIRARRPDHKRRLLVSVVRVHVPGTHTSIVELCSLRQVPEVRLVIRFSCIPDASYNRRTAEFRRRLRANDAPVHTDVLFHGDLRLVPDILQFLRAATPEETNRFLGILGLWRSVDGAWYAIRYLGTKHHSMATTVIESMCRDEPPPQMNLGMRSPVELRADVSEWLSRRDKEIRDWLDQPAAHATSKAQD